MPQQNASRDNNNITGKLAVLNTDTIQGTHLVRIAINSTSGGISVDEAATISFPMLPVAPRDDDYVGVWLFQGTDGKTYPAVATSSGSLLITT
jgi:hypothetical protein